jgi:hypothetical protein
MATSILILLSIALLVMMTKIDLSSFHGLETKRLLLLGLTLSLVQLARLDAVFLNCLVLGTIIAINGRSTHSAKLLKNLFILATPSLITGSTYLIANYTAFRHLVPVSGMSKSMGRFSVNQNMLAQLTELRSLGDFTKIWTIFSALSILGVAYLIIFFGKQKSKVDTIGAASGSYVAAIT